MSPCHQVVTCADELVAIGSYSSVALTSCHNSPRQGPQGLRQCSALPGFQSIARKSSPLIAAQAATSTGPTMARSSPRLMRFTLPLMGI